MEENAKGVNVTVPRARVFESYNVNSRSANDTHPQPLDRTTCQKIKAQLKASHLWRRECHVSSVENVTSAAQKEPRHQSATWKKGEAFIFSLRTSVSSRLGRLCTVPSPDVDQSQSQSQRLVRPLKGPKEESQQIDCLRRRQVKVSPC